ncbi:MFS transporter [Streptomyces sp. URMC 123]|uniref:MFS transporter n=1 Tax=Streptomyces sp. URMC 123 TaxID=3423403 RepID=UPI003F1C9F27
MPLAFVFLARDRPGGYGLGALLAAVFVLGEVSGAAFLGPRLRPKRVLTQLGAGFGVGAVAFAGLGLLRGAHPLVLGALAAVAGAAPAAGPAGMRTLLTSQVPERLLPRALSAETILGYGIWALAPVVVSWLALDLTPHAPLLLASVLAFTAARGLRALPVHWVVDDVVPKQSAILRAVAHAWPAYLMGAAALTLLALAELVLPALLEQRGMGVGWAGPLLTGHSIAAVLGAFLYGVRTWPGPVRVQGVVLVFGVTACVAAAAAGRSLAAIAVALAAGGLLQAGAQITRHLALRESLAPAALAAGYSVMAATAGIGYALGATLAGAILRMTTPAATILAGVTLTLVLATVGALGERRRRTSGPQTPGQPPHGGPEGAPVGAW